MPLGQALERLRKGNLRTDLNSNLFNHVTFGQPDFQHPLHGWIRMTARLSRRLIGGQDLGGLPQVGSSRRSELHLLDRVGWVSHVNSPEKVALSETPARPLASVVRQEQPDLRNC
jgi:hypothetical protein